MATTTRLSLYNGALRLLGQRQLASLTEAQESRRMLDACWDDNVVARALEAGDWLFALRSMQYDYSPSVTMEFGFQRAFNKPDDFVRTTSICSDEYFTQPMTAREYADEAGYWFCDLDTIYVKYVSKDSTYGMDFSRWPQTFVKYVQALMASEIALPLTQNRQQWLDLQGLAREFLKQAESNNSMAEGSKQLPQGSWARARSIFGWGRRSGE